MKKINIKTISNINLGILTVLYLGILEYVINVDIRLKTILFILFLIIIQKLRNKKYINFEKIPKFNIRVNYLFIFLITIVFQNALLNYEVISIDIPSYLVASQVVNLEILPYEVQWESKGPLFMYLYKLVIVLASSNYLYFRLLNDVILFIITILIYKIIYLRSKNSLSALNGSILFLLITSYEWYVSEYSEIYCLIFILYQYFHLKKNGLSSKSIIISSLLISFSSLINQGTAIFMAALGFVIILNYKKKSIKKLFFAGISFFVPHLLFYLVYFVNDVGILYVTNYFFIPLNYVDSGNFRLYELLVWLKRYFLYFENLYYLIISIPFFIIINNLNKKIIYSKDFMSDIIYLGISFSFYFIAGHNYQHHLFYLIAFIAIFTSHIANLSNKSLFSLLIFICTFQVIINLFPSSFNNLKSLEETYENYPLYSLSQEIEKYYPDKNYSVLAVDKVLTLFYLEKQNISYIVHPFNHYETYIVDSLIQTQKLQTNKNSHLSFSIEQEPDVVICLPTQIISGNPTASDIFNCEVTDYKKNYQKLDTQIYNDNLNKEYYLDPYAKMRVYIKDS